MKNKPNFERFRKAMYLQQPDRVPLAEVLISDQVKSKFLGKEVKDNDMECQVEFWSRAGYDFLPVVVGMLGPGRVTDAAKIYAIQDRNSGKKLNIAIRSCIIPPGF